MNKMIILIISLSVIGLSVLAVRIGAQILDRIFTERSNLLLANSKDISRFEVLWRLEKGDFSYAKFKIQEIKYNIADKKQISPVEWHTKEVYKKA
jgi:hypothetical protein